MQPKRLWTGDDTAALRRLVAAGMTDAQIGEDMDRDPGVIRSKRREHGIEPGISRAAKAMIARLNLRRARIRSATS
jgi:hypothetical protein